MSAYKKLNQQDVYVTSYNARKSWAATGSLYDSYGIQILTAQSSSNSSYYLNSSDLYNNQYKQLVHRSLDQLYFKSFDQTSGSIIATSSFDNYIESSFTSASRHLYENALIYSLPRDVIGTHIEPGSITFGLDESTLYIENQNDYIAEGYMDGTDLLYDNGEGILAESRTSNEAKGVVIYSHGQIIVTDPNSYVTFVNNPRVPLAWKSNLPIYTYNYSVKVSDYEFNFTNNPTAQSGSYVQNYSGSYYNRPSGVLTDNVTGSYFQPYITTVGLYNDANELIAVAKLAKPLPKPSNTELAIHVKLDI